MRGSIIKRGSRYSVVIDVGRDPATGKRIREWHSGYETRKAAERARIEILHTLDNGGHVPRAALTLGEYLLDEWLLSRKPRQRAAGRGYRGQVGVGTYDTYKGTVEAYILPRLGSIRLQDLDATHLDVLYDELEERGRLRDGAGLATNTIVGVHAVLHKALRDAVRRRRVARNVADDVALPRAARVEMPVWTVEELRAFLTHVRKDRLYAAWLLFSTTGMRRGEVCGLAWPDTEVRRRRARHVARPRHRQRATGAPVRQQEERDEIGAGWVARNTDWRGQHRDNLVFTWQDGRMINPRRISVWFIRHRQEAGLPPIRLHDYADIRIMPSSWQELRFDLGVCSGSMLKLSA